MDVHVRDVQYATIVYVYVCVCVCVCVGWGMALNFNLVKIVLNIVE